MKNYNSESHSLSGNTDTSSSPSLIPTAICENIHSKRTIAEALSHLKRALSEKGYRVTSSTVISETFSDVVYHNGCVSLKGREIKGSTLYDMYKNFTPGTTFSSFGTIFLTVIKRIIETSVLVNLKTGSYPPLLLNSIVLNDNGIEVTYLPFLIIDFVNRHCTAELQKLLHFCCLYTEKIRSLQNISLKNSTTGGSYFVTEAEFASSLAKLIYLFLSKKKKTFENKEQPQPVPDIPEEPFLYPGSFFKDMPEKLSDAVWSLLHGQIIELSTLKEIIDTCFTHEQPISTPQRIPLFRRSASILFLYNIRNFFSKRWKPVLIVLICLGAAFYLISDYFSERNSIDYTRGLNPQQVVELYYKAVDNLHLDIIDSLFYKRKGKEIKNELSTLYVMMKMDQAFGQKLMKPDQIEGINNLPPDYRVFGIKNLYIKNIGTDEYPVFLARYTKVLSSEDKIYETKMEETIYLKKYKDHWYIIQSVRKITDSEESAP